MLNEYTEATAANGINTSMTIENQGRFMVPLKSVQKEPLKLARIFAAMTFVPVRAEIIDFGLSVDYIGLSHLFRKVPQDAEIPHYLVEAEYTESGELVNIVAKEV